MHKNTTHAQCAKALASKSIVFYRKKKMESGSGQKRARRSLDRETMRRAADRIADIPAGVSG
jgi:hypothetical protein